MPADDTDRGAPGETPEPEDQRSRPRRRRRFIIMGVGVVLLVWLLLAGTALSRAASAARAGQAELENLKGVVGDDLQAFVRFLNDDGDSPTPAETARRFQSAADSFAEAGQEMDAGVVKPLSILPVVGRQLDSASTLADAAQTTTEQAATAFRGLEEVVAAPASTGQERLSAGERTQDILEQFRTSIDDLDLGPDEALVTPLAESRNQFSEEYSDILEVLDTATTAVAGVNDFLRGPNTYLVLASNNAEMRAGSGMFLQVGTMEVADGSFTLGEFFPAEDLFLASPAGTQDEDFARNWAWLQPDQEWRNLNLTPRFDVSAQMAAAMWEAAGGDPVDGVVSIDVVGLKHLLELVGPVEVGLPGEQEVITADTVLPELLLDQYVEFTGDRDTRRERLGSVAGAALGALDEGNFPASGLVSMFQRAGRDRHMMLWSSDPTQMAGWSALGATGELPGNAIMLSLINRGGNKLDQFMSVRTDVSVVPEGETNRVTLDINVTNEAPLWLPTYVQGPHPRSEVAAGDYLGIASVTMPDGVGNITVKGLQPGFTGDDGNTRVAAAPIQVPRGTTTSFTVEFTLPTFWQSVAVQPAARFPPTAWSFRDQTWTDDRNRVIPLDEKAE